MASPMSSLGPGNLHCRPFAHTAVQIAYRISIHPNLGKTRRGSSPPAILLYQLVGVRRALDSASKSDSRSDLGVCCCFGISGVNGSACHSGLQKGWNEMDAAPLASPCGLRSDTEGRVASGTGLASSVALVLALGSAAYLALPDTAAAADLHDRLQHFHPVAADLNQLAESVSLGFAPSPASK